MRAMWNRWKVIAIKPGFIGWLLVALGIGLRLRQYIANRSFWVDEATLALNLTHRNFWGLMKPLDYEQGEPVGFLFIEKSIITILGNRDYILRLFPLFSGILAGILSYLIVNSLVKSKIGSLFAALFFAISWPLIYYSSELKQYSSDVMVGLLLIYLSLRCLDELDHLFKYHCLRWLQKRYADILRSISRSIWFGDRQFSSHRRSCIFI